MFSLPILELMSGLMLLAQSIAPAPQAPRPLAFSATLTSIKADARLGQVLTRQFQLTLDPGQARTQFKARVEDWWRSPDGQRSFYAEPGTLRHSCARWATVNPVESAVGGGETLTVRITVTVPTELPPGGYWCVLTVDEVPDPATASDGVGVRFKASVSTGIFLYLGPIERSAQVLGIRVDNDRVGIQVRNTGNAPLGVEGRVQFFQSGSETPVATVDLPRSTLLTEPFVEGEVSAALPSAAILPSGRYRVRAILDIGAAQDLGAEREVVLVRTAPLNAAGR
jgi:hypothetical protein